MINENIFPLEYDHRPLKHHKSKRRKEDPNPICHKLNTLDPYLKPSSSQSAEEPI